MDNELARTQVLALTPGAKAAFWASLGVCMGVLAWAEYLQPSQQPYTGKWGWLKSWALQALGPAGIVWLWLGQGALLILLAGLQWHRAQRQRKTPGPPPAP